MKLVCSECKKYLGQMIKGELRNGTKNICRECMTVINQERLVNKLNSIKGPKRKEKGMFSSSLFDDIF